jgi:ketosteroid isomerase-like protein
MGDSDTEKQVEQAFDQIFEAIHAADANKLEGLLANRPGSAPIGSDPAESWSKSQFVAMVKEALSAGGSQVRAEHDKVNVQIAGDVAWIDTTVRFISDEGAQRDTRLTGVTAREGGRWKGAQSHVSIGVPNDAIFEA